VLAAAFGAAAGLLVDSLSFAVSTFCLLLAHEPKGRPRAQPSAAHLLPQSIWREVREGLAFVWHSRILRLFTGVAALANMTMTAYEAILVVFLVRTVHLSFLAIGLLMAATGIGGVLGAFAAPSLVRRLGEVRTILLSMAATGPFGLLIPLTSRGWAVMFFVFGSTVPVSGLIIFNIVVGSFRQKHSPRPLLGRISATMRFLLFGAIPIGAVIGGALGSGLGLRNALWWIMSAAVLPGLILVASPLRRMRELSLDIPADIAIPEYEADPGDGALATDTATQLAPGVAR
jgi:predicted MFS family arabinose efflux permease